MTSTVDGSLWKNTCAPPANASTYVVCLRKDGDDLFGNSALAADVGEWSSHDAVNRLSVVLPWRFDSTFMDRSVVSS